MRDYDLMRLCIKEKWLTCGTAQQYDKIFKINNNGAVPLAQSEQILARVAFAIWLCSDDKLHLTTEKIKSILLENERKSQ